MHEVIHPRVNGAFRSVKGGNAHFFCKSLRTNEKEFCKNGAFTLRRLIFYK